MTNIPLMGMEYHTAKVTEAPIQNSLESISACKRLRTQKMSGFQSNIMHKLYTCGRTCKSMEKLKRLSTRDQPTYKGTLQKTTTIMQLCTGLKEQLTRWKPPMMIDLLSSLNESVHKCEVVPKWLTQKIEMGYNILALTNVPHKQTADTSLPIWRPLGVLTGFTSRRMAQHDWINFGYFSPCDTRECVRSPVMSLR